MKSEGGEAKEFSSKDRNTSVCKILESGTTFWRSLVFDVDDEVQILEERPAELGEKRVNYVVCNDLND